MKLKYYIVNGENVVCLIWQTEKYSIVPVFAGIPIDVNNNLLIFACDESGSTQVEDINLIDLILYVMPFNEDTV